jgi:hypothetical protein
LISFSARVSRFSWPEETPQFDSSFWGKLRRSLPHVFYFRTILLTVRMSARLSFLQETDVPIAAGPTSGTARFASRRRGGVGALMVGLFKQSATARAGQAEAEIARACDAIASAYRFFAIDWQGPSKDSGAAGLRRDLGPVVQTALRDRTGIEGGIWQDDTGSLAYAFPTYQGSGPKTDVPQAEMDRIRSVNQAAFTDDRASVSRFDASSQILLLTACPLRGPVPRLTAWTMTRVQTIGGRSYQQLMAGLGTLLLTVLAGTALLGHLTINWSRHVRRIAWPRWDCESRVRRRQ